MLMRVTTFIDGFNRVVGKAVAVTSLLMVLMMCWNVGLRYLFSEGVPWQQEIVRFMHGALFLLGAAYALQREQHVRVDILYQGFNEHQKARVNIIGTFIFLFPVAFALIYFSQHFVLSSWKIFEGSTEYKGMPGVFLFKSCIWGCGGMLMLQGISTILHSLRVLKGKEAIAPSKHEEHL